MHADTYKPILSVQILPMETVDRFVPGKTYSPLRNSGHNSRPRGKTEASLKALAIVYLIANLAA